MLWRSGLSRPRTQVRLLVVPDLGPFLRYAFFSGSKSFSNRIRTTKYHTRRKRSAGTETCVQQVYGRVQLGAHTVNDPRSLSQSRARPPRSNQISVRPV